MAGDEQPIAFDCPRCGSRVEETFWGPCRACRREMVSRLGRAPAESLDPPGGTRFEPAVHVVANHVATKE